MPPPLLSLAGPTGIPPFRNANPSATQALSAGLVSLVLPSNAPLEIAYRLTNQPVTPQAPTEYTRQYSAEIYQVVFNGLTEGQSTVDTLDRQTAAQQSQLVSALLNPPPLTNTPPATPPAQPVSQAPSAPAPTPPAAAAVTAPAPAPAPPAPPVPSAPAPPAAAAPAPVASQAAATDLQISAGAPAAPTPAQAVIAPASGAGA